MKQGKSDNSWLFIIGGLAVILLVSGVIPMPAFLTTESSMGDSSSDGSVGYATTITAGGENEITGAAVDVNSYVFANDNSFVVGETQTNSKPESLSTSAPNSMSGFLMIGNDANQGTDRGTEVYFRKVPFSYSSTGAYQIKDTDGSVWIGLASEGTPTWTGYDDGTAESTLNITIGSGQTIVSTELKIAASSDAYLGNPDFANPLGICFNVSSTAKFDVVKPANYVGTFDAPEAYSGYNILGDCYILPTGALKDYEQFRFYIVIDAATGQNPAGTDYVGAILVDKVWALNDNGEFEAGWGDDSVEGTDYDAGLDGLGNAKYIHLN